MNTKIVIGTLFLVLILSISGNIVDELNNIYKNVETRDIRGQYIQISDFIEHNTDFSISEIRDACYNDALIFHRDLCLMGVMRETKNENDRKELCIQITDEINETIYSGTYQFREHVTLRESCFYTLINIYSRDNPDGYCNKLDDRFKSSCYLGYAAKTGFKEYCDKISEQFTEKRSRCYRIDEERTNRKTTPEERWRRQNLESAARYKKELESKKQQKIIISLFVLCLLVALFHHYKTKKSRVMKESSKEVTSDDN